MLEFEGQPLVAQTTFDAGLHILQSHYRGTSKAVQCHLLPSVAASDEHRNLRGKLKLNGYDMSMI